MTNPAFTPESSGRFWPAAMLYGQKLRPSAARILVAGDESLLCQTFLRHFIQELGRAGYQVTDLTGKVEASRLAQETRWIQLALVVMDFPPGQSLELVNWLKLNQPEIRLLLVRESQCRLTELVPMLKAIPQMVMPFTTEQLIVRVGQLLNCEPGFTAVPPGSPPSPKDKRT